MRAELLRSMAVNPMAFRDHLMIVADRGSVRLNDCLDDWQKRDFENMDAGWMQVIGRSHNPDVNPDVRCRAYLERPRGHSKTSDLAIMASWCLAFSTKRIAGIAGSGDRDQAKLLRDAIDRLLISNEWLGQVLQAQKTQVVNKRTGSSLEILSADAPSAFGHLADFVLVDELSNWTDGGEAFWHALFSTVAKKKNCMCVVISNAGTGQGSSWQWRVRESCRVDPQWYFSRLDGPQASWIGEQQLEEQRRLLPAVAFDRLWLNRWTTGSGDALSEADINAAVTLDSQPEPQREYVYGAGLDLGLSRDCTALVVVGRNVRRPYRDKVRVAYVRAWKPRPGLRVSIETIEEAILDVHKRFNLRLLAYDPWQSDYLADRLRKQGINARETHFTAKNLQEMATTTLEAFSERQIELYPHDELLSDLRNLRVSERSYGWRLDPVRDGSGHGDRAIALSLSLLVAKELDRYSRRVWGGVIDCKSIPIARRW